MWKENGKYHPVSTTRAGVDSHSGSSDAVTHHQQQQQQDDSTLVSSYRVTPGGPSFPEMAELVMPTTICSSTNDNSTGNKRNNSRDLVEDCVVGGVLWKLQHFCLEQGKERGRGKVLRVQLIMAAVYLVCMFGTLHVFAAGKEKHGSTGIVAVKDGHGNIQEDSGQDEAQFRFWLVMFPGLAVTAVYVAAVMIARKRLLGPDNFRSSLCVLIQQIAEDLEPVGYIITPEEIKERSILSFLSPFPSGKHVSFSLRRQPRQHHPGRLPPVSQEFQDRISELPTKEIKLNVESIVRRILVSVPSSVAGLLPVDDWVAGGMKLRLQEDRYRASQRSRYLGLFLLVPTGIIWVLAQLANDNRDGGVSILYSFAMGSVLYVCYEYIQELLDRREVHSVSRAVVKQFAGIVKERHGQVLHYEVQSGDLLPRTTKGVITFQPLGTGGNGKEKNAAQIAFV